MNLVMLALLLYPKHMRRRVIMDEVNYGSQLSTSIDRPAAHLSFSSSGQLCHVIRSFFLLPPCMLNGRV
ncbi:hypothetical protein LIER_32653 [Lithospermum erythrorhizon]|uniref:Uncharacterized protein n=1 Tax=Lithospermum erythrorhizon TaxID=34254 RepID=A0AAV3RWY9_LITER